LSTSLQQVVLVSYHAEFIWLAHENMTGGHLGRRSTEAQIQRRGYWPGCSENVRRFLCTFRPCVQDHRGLPSQLAQLKPMLVGEPFEIVCQHHGASSPFIEEPCFPVVNYGQFHEMIRGNTIEESTAPNVVVTVTSYISCNSLFYFTVYFQCLLVRECVQSFSHINEYFVMLYKLAS